MQAKENQAADQKRKSQTGSSREQEHEVNVSHTVYLHKKKPKHTNRNSVDLIPNRV